MDSASLAPGTDAVLEKHRFDVPALERYLREHVDGFSGSLTVSQFRGGQSNPTYFLAAGRRCYVLRRKPPGKLLPSAHAVDREYRVITALGTIGYPVPKTHVFCGDDAVIGTSFYVMDYVPGRVFADPRLPGPTAAERAAIYDSLNECLARLHTVDFEAIGLGDFGKRGQYVARQIHRWTAQYRASETERIEAMEQLIAWLPRHIPAEDPTTLVHGDFRPGNVLIHPAEPRVVAVLDWELSTLGHPLSDLAYSCMPYHLPPEDTLGGIAGPALARSGIPPEAEYIAAYCRRTGRAEIEHWDFYIAFSMFRLAAIAQGIMGRVLAGTANDPNAAERGRRARPLAETGWALIEKRSGA
jgi:aminoglycoside phosphotransferase (APT) family kinase protein